MSQGPDYGRVCSQEEILMFLKQMEKKLEQKGTNL